MKPSILLGAAAGLMKSKKMKIVFAAINLGILAYSYAQQKSKKNEAIAEESYS